MRLRSIFGVSCYFLLVFTSCGASSSVAKKGALVARQTTVTTIAMAQQAPAIDTVIKDTLKINLIDTNAVMVDSSLFTVLTPEQRLIDQKRLGVNKEANWASAMHYDLRKPNYVIIHHTSQNSVAQTVRTFQVPHAKVSAHYIVAKDGQVIQMLNDYDRAWHAGRSKWGTITDMNSVSLGIELDNNGKEPFPELQIQALLNLLETLKSKYLIPQLNFIGHADIAPMRKDDPNVFFPWKKLAERGFGVWYNEDFLMDPPVNFNPIDALKIIGYDMSRPDAAIRAFKRKYVITEVNGVLNDFDKKILYDLYRKYY